MSDRPVAPPEEERFAVGVRLGDLQIEFFIDSKSTQSKRWAFFGLLTMIVLLLLAGELQPQLMGYVK